MTPEKLLAVIQKSRNGTDHYHRHWFVHHFLYTDGVKEVAETAHAYWLLDRLAAEQAQTVLSWFEAGGGNTGHIKLDVADSNATLTLEGKDQDGHQVQRTQLGYTDFPAGHWAFKLCVNRSSKGYVVVACLYSED